MCYHSKMLGHVEKRAASVSCFPSGIRRGYDTKFLSLCMTLFCRQQVICTSLQVCCTLVNTQHIKQIRNHFVDAYKLLENPYEGISNLL